MNKRLKIAVTGGIGSGKSIFTDIFREKGGSVILADTVAKDIMQNNAEVAMKIKETFGADAFLNGTLNREYLSDSVFSSAENTALINGIVHPPVIRAISEEMEKILKTEESVLVECALLFEAGMENLFDYVVLIEADEDIRIKRVMQRDSLSRGDIQRRLFSQLPDEAKRDFVDFTIENNSDIEDFKKKSSFIIELLKKV